MYGTCLIRQGASWLDVLATTLGPRLLPATTAGSPIADLSRHANTLVEQYDLASSEVVRRAIAPVSVEGPDNPGPPTHVDVAAALIGPSSGVAEVIVPPRSPLVAISTRTKSSSEMTNISR